MSNAAPKTEAPRPASADNNTRIKAEDGQQEASRNEWMSERDLVSSLWKLQELESKIHQLRTLLPDRLLAPLAPIVRPRRDTATGSDASSSIPKSPAVLNEQLSRSARAGVAEVNEFRSLWNSPELTSVWESVDARLRESNGVCPQPSGMWERDYDVLLKNLEEQRRQPDEQEERTTATTTTTTTAARTEEEEDKKNEQGGRDGWNNVLEAFEKRQPPGFRILRSRNESLLTTYLAPAGLAFDLQEVLGSSSDSRGPVTEWRVSEKTQRQQARGSRLEAAICACLNARSRKWDLAYLLNMVYAYADIKQTPCKKCNMMMDSTAQLPVVRRPVIVDSPDGSESTVWEAYHSDCV